MAKILVYGNKRNSKVKDEYEIEIDDCDYKQVIGCNWHMLNGYAVTKDLGIINKDGKKMLVGMHRMIAGLFIAGVYEKGAFVKFKDGNMFNLKRDNLYVGRRDSKLRDVYDRLREKTKEMNQALELKMIENEMNENVEKSEREIKEKKIREEVIQKLKMDKDENLIKKYFTAVENDMGEIDIKKFKI